MPEATISTRRIRIANHKFLCLIPLPPKEKTECVVNHRELIAFAAGGGFIPFTRDEAMFAKDLLGPHSLLGLHEFRILVGDGEKTDWLIIFSIDRDGDLDVPFAMNSIGSAVVDGHQGFVFMERQ